MSKLAASQASNIHHKDTPFSALLPAPIVSFFKEQDAIAIGVSGGCDSIAMAHILRQAYPDKKILAFTVDHGLRPESEDEAIKVGTMLRDIADHHEILTWQGDKPDHSIQAAARKARYDLFQEACALHQLNHICLAHHSDDQAETFLHRLAKGSGIQGLTGMRPISKNAQDLIIVRPFLKTSHNELRTYCKINDLNWIEDPSNQDTKFARVRFRQSRDFLEAEGLSNERIVRLCTRLERANDALRHYTNAIFDDYVIIDERGARIDKKTHDLPSEVRLRLVLKTASIVSPNHNIASRLERLETLLFDDNTPKFTLSGLIFTKHKDADITLSLEALDRLPLDN